MSKGAHLTLRPDRCNECGKCVAACPNDAVRAGADYILIDWHVCNQCCACVDACAPGAIQREIVPVRSAGVAIPVAPGDVTKVRVGSRAEAKAVRKAAEQAAKQAAKAASHPAAPRVVLATSGPGNADAAADAPAPAAAARSAVRPPAERRASAPKATARERDGARARWTLVDGAVVLAVLTLTIVAKNAALAIPAIALMPAIGQAVTRAAVLALYYAVQVAALVFLAGRHGTTFLRAFGLARDPDAPVSAERPSALVSAGLVVALLVGVEVVALGYGLAATSLGWHQPVTLSSDVASVFGMGGVGLSLSALLVAVVAPFAEELAFRGVILDAIGERLGMWPSIVITALLFAAYHLNAWLFLPMLVFGVALGWLAWTRRSLWPAIALHVLYNGLAVAAAFLVPK